MKFHLAVIASLLTVALASNAAAKIIDQDWGTTTKGEKVKLYTLKGRGGMEIKISNFGAVITSLLVPDNKGKLRDIVMGYPSVADYDKPGGMGIFSALIGPYANQLGVDFKIAGKTYHQTQTPQAGRTSIGHSGDIGFHKRVWQAEPRDGVEPSIAMTIKDSDGLGGFPGNVTVTVTFTLKRDNTLVIDFKGTTDKPTVLNLTDHFYFSLNGEGNGEIGNEMLTLYADRYTPDYVTSRVNSVEGTVFDLRKPTRLGDRLALPEVGNGYNTNMILEGIPGQLRPAARLDDPDSGITLVMFTTQPAVQLYTDNEKVPFNGKNGHVYHTHNAISLEPQHYPDSPNHPEFPSTEVTPDKPFHEIAEYRFAVRK
jgi:aldose 1-epimerase